MRTLILVCIVFIAGTVYGGGGFFDDGSKTILKEDGTWSTFNCIGGVCNEFKNESWFEQFKSSKYPC